MQSNAKKVKSPRRTHNITHNFFYNAHDTQTQQHAATFCYKFKSLHFSLYVNVENNQGHSFTKKLLTFREKIILRDLKKYIKLDIYKVKLFLNFVCTLDNLLSSNVCVSNVSN